MSLAARARMRPVLYPSAILLVIVLDVVVSAGHGEDVAIATQASIWSAGRPLVVAAIGGLAVTWLLGVVVGDRDLAGLIAALLVAGLFANSESTVMLIVFAVIAAWGAWTALRRLRARSAHTAPVPWHSASRLGNAIAAVLVVALGLQAVQLGQVETIAHDAVAESPLRGTAAAAASVADAPDIYLILLDGYPRPDVLRRRFGIDADGFTSTLRSRGFTYAPASRSNYTTTELTLASMFGGFSAPTGSATGPRRLINEGSIVAAFRERGYRIVAFATGFEGIAMRQADTFIDSGQLNEVEWNLLYRARISRLVNLVAPRLQEEQHRLRILSTLDTLPTLAVARSDRPRLVLAHVASPHSPQVFDASGGALDVGAMDFPFDPAAEIETLGPAEFARRLAGQVAYLDSRVADIVDRIVESDPRAVIVVFSDHGTTALDPAGLGSEWDTDLRTANLLAVRSPGRTGIIDDRSTLVNLLPRILRAYTGSGPADVPETIYGRLDDGTFVEFDRPD